MRAVDPAQAVQLVDHDVAQVLEELHPLGVVRQDALVQHVGVGDHDVRARADRLARVLRRVPVVGERADVRPDRLDHRVELGQLVLGQRLRGKEVERPRVGVLEDAVEDGKVVAEGLARGGRRDDDHVLAALDELERLALVAVEALVAPPDERVAQLRVQLPREVHHAGRLGREVPQRGEHRLAAEGLLDLEALQDGKEGRRTVTARRNGPGRGGDELLGQDDLLRGPSGQGPA